MRVAVIGPTLPMTHLHEFARQDIEKAIGVLEDFLERHPAAASLTHFNILAELHLQQGRHQRVADVLRTAADTFGNQELPIDLQVGYDQTFLYGAFKDLALYILTQQSVRRRNLTGT